LNAYSLFLLGLPEEKKLYIANTTGILMLIATRTSSKTMLTTNEIHPFQRFNSSNLKRYRITS